MTPNLNTTSAREMVRKSDFMVPVEEIRDMNLRTGMIQDQQSLVTLRDTFGANMRFLIPDYQRGYKWSVAEVRKLLEDVDAFKPEDGLEYYCLQNLTLVQGTADTPLKVVDGQQRLTTCSIILSYLKYRKNVDKNLGFEELPALKTDIEAQLSFGERKKDTTQPFFDEEILNLSFWKDVDNDVLTNEVWFSVGKQGDKSDTLHKLFDKWLEGKDQHRLDHSDIFHMFCAAMTVAAFFKEHVAPDKFAKKFLDEVRFLHNIVEGTEQGNGVLEAEIFSKINGFRVPLDGADLLRAIFITYAVDKKAIGGGLTEREVRFNEARVKLGLELDEMSAWWQDDCHKKYFAMFVLDNDKATPFNLDRYPINILYRLYAASKGESIVDVDWFEKNTNIPELYSNIRHFHSVLRDWYDDEKLYHFAGFLVSQCGQEFSKIYSLLLDTSKRTKLYKSMKEQIFIGVTKKKDDKSGSVVHSYKDRWDSLAKEIVSDSCNWYDEEVYSAKKVLVLMDVISYTEQKQQQNEGNEVGRNRTPLASHLDPEFFSCVGEDKEHIFPQTPIGRKDFRRNPAVLREKMKEYWDFVSKVCKEFQQDGASAVYLGEEWNKYWKACEEQMKISNGEEVFPLTFGNDDDAQKWIDWFFAKNERDEVTIRRINRFVTNHCGIDLNSIGNIVMLDAGINRGYGNGFFTEKRRKIWAKYRSCQPVRLHTYRVFAKEFEDDGLDEKWGQKSIEKNRVAIKEVLKKFFNELIEDEGGVQ